MPIRMLPEPDPRCKQCGRKMPPRLPSNGRRGFVKGSRIKYCSAECAAIGRKISEMRRRSAPENVEKAKLWREKTREHRKAMRAANKEKHREYHQAWWQKNKEYMSTRAQRLKRAEHARAFRERRKNRKEQGRE